MKALRRRMAKIGAEVADLGRERTDVVGRMKDKQRQLARLDHELKAVSGQDIEITDHAILRFMERVDGFDVQPIIDRIVTTKLREQVDIVGGTGEFPCEGGRLVMENKRIITVKT